MTVNDFHAWIRQKPFVPFRVITASGRAFEVPAPHLILTCPDTVVIGQPHADDPLAASRYDMVPLREVVRLEARDGAVPPSA
jgi:hypothetical protein